MAIRFTCSECASELKIKDELAGTSGRCPKCKTKFVVPSPRLEVEVPDAYQGTVVETDGSESLDEQNSDRADLRSGENRDRESRDDVIPLGFNPAETLRLEDSDDDLEALDDGPSTNHEQPPRPEIDLVASDEDDLDSPPMMVSHPMLAAKSVSIPAHSQQNETRSISAEKAASASTSSRPKTTEAPFDPLRFLMSDQPGPVSDPDSSLANTDRGDAVSDFSLPVENDDVLADRLSPRPLNRPTPATKSSSRPQPEKIDLATAAKMMKKAIKDSQAAEAQQRDVDAKAGFDYGQIFREFGLRGLAIVVGIVVMCAALYYVTDSMFSSRLKLPKMGYVSGVVKLDGQPLSGATVTFSPIEEEVKSSKKGSNRERIRSSLGMSDDNGHFKLMYIPADRIEGVAVGRCRVWVSHVGPKGRSDVPPEWSEGAMLVKEVTPGNQKAPFEINMETKSNATKTK